MYGAFEASIGGGVKGAVQQAGEQRIFWIRIRFGLAGDGRGEGEGRRDVAERAGVDLEEGFDHFGEEVCEGLLDVLDDGGMHG